MRSVLHEMDWLGMTGGGMRMPDGPFERIEACVIG